LNSFYLNKIDNGLSFYLNGFYLIVSIWIFYLNNFYLNKIDNGLSNKPKHLNKMFNFIVAVLFLVKLFLKSKFYATKNKFIFLFYGS